MQKRELKLSAKRGASQKRDKEREESAKAQQEEARKREGKRESAKAKGKKKPSSGEEDTKKRQAEADERSKRRFGTGSYDDASKEGIWGNVGKVVGAIGTIGAVAVGAKKIQEINAAQRLGISTNPLVWDEYDREDIHEEIARHNDELEAARKERTRRDTPTSTRKKNLTGGNRKIPFRKRYTKKSFGKSKTRRVSPKRRKKRRKRRRTRKGGVRKTSHRTKRRR